MTDTLDIGSAARAVPAPSAPRHLSNIQVLRGVAALMVLVYHVGNEFGDRGFPGPFPDVGAGSAGVDLFFVVSGFIMVHSTADAFGRRGAPGLFLLRRVVRLVPLYWLITTAFVLREVHAARHAGLPAETWRWFAASYAFLFYPHGDGGDYPLYPQGWTLNYEMLFYACFAAVLPLRRAVALPALAAGLAGFAALGLAVRLPWPLDRWSDTVVLEFVLGLGLAEVYARGIRIRLATAVALAAAGFATFVFTIGSVDGWLPYRGLVWGPPALAVVAAGALYAPRRAGPLRSALEALGDSSYALYLVHYAFFVALGDALGRFVPVASLSPALYGGACIAGAVAVAFAVHRAVEAPITRGLNRGLGLGRRWRRLTGGAPVRA